MANWVLKGLRTGIKTTPYPRHADDAPGISPGRPRGTPLGSTEKADELAERCPTGAIVSQNSGVAIDHGSCVHCFRCHESDNENAVTWERGYEWAAYAGERAKAQHKMDRIFGRSLHLRFVDVGACGACISEARQLNNPYYNMHRLGFFITPTPRNADVLLVAGPVSDAMRLPLRKTYEAMPSPKRSLRYFGRCLWPEFCGLGRGCGSDPGRCGRAWVPTAAARYPPRPAPRRREKTAIGPGLFPAGAGS